MRRVAILISGGGSNLVALVKSMTGDHPARAVLVLSNDPGAAGLAKARDLGVATAAVDHRPFGADRAGFEAKAADYAAATGRLRDAVTAGDSAAAATEWAAVRATCGSCHEAYRE